MPFSVPPVSLSPVEEAPSAPASTAWVDSAAVAALADPENLLEADPAREGWPAQPFADSHLRLLWPGTMKRVSLYTTDHGNYYLAQHLVNWPLAVRHRDNATKRAPALATRVVASEDGRSFRIHLREGVVWQEPDVDWSTGTFDWLRGPHPLTAADFIATLEASADPRIQGPLARLKLPLDGPPRMIDAHTFEVRLTHANPAHFAKVMDLYPLPRWLYQHDQDGTRIDDELWVNALPTHWYNDIGTIGVGPYRLTRWDPDQQLVFERDPRFQGPPPAFEQVSYRIVSDKTRWASRFKSGEFDVVELAASAFEQALQDPETPLGIEGAKVELRPDKGVINIAWNGSNPRFADARVRRALTHAIPRAQILETVFRSSGVLVSGPFVRESPCYDESIAPLPYDPEKARALLTEAGWVDADEDGVREKVVDGEKLELRFELTLILSEEWTDIGAIAREAFNDVGVHAALTSAPFAEAGSLRSKRQYDGIAGGLNTRYPIDLRPFWHSSAAAETDSYNAYDYRSARVDALIEEMEQSFDGDRRMELCRAIHDAIHEDQPITTMFQRARPMIRAAHVAPLVFPADFPTLDPLWQRPQ